MFSRFFIDRPIFATVLAVVLVTIGAVSIFSLPISQYPEIAPPTVVVNTVYPGASAEVVSDTVAQPIEQQVNGVEGMLYMTGTCSNDGGYQLEVTFEIGTDLDIATNQVQQRIAAAEARLPTEVAQQGIVTRKRSPNFVQLVVLESPDQSRDGLFLQNYAILNLVDELSRIEGVGQVFLPATGDYSMRIWLDPQALRARDLTANDVLAAVRSQNVQAAAGQIGRPPVPDGQAQQLTVVAQGRLAEPEEFEQIVVSRDNGRLVRVSDVGYVELGAQTYDVQPTTDNQATAFLIVYQLPGSNALDVANRVTSTLDELAADFPSGVDYRVVLDNTKFVTTSIRQIFITLGITTLIVGLVIFAFLQDWRATVIPIVTIPVSLTATFAVLAAMGLTINTITLLALVLAIGIVVDDAIVVVENASRIIREGEKNPRDATVQAMKEVTGPIVATTLVLLAVFIPTAFIGGLSGELFTQFGITLSTATVFSSLNALTLSPALCALLIKPRDDAEGRGWLGRTTGKLRDKFDAVFDKLTGGYLWLVRKAIAAWVVTVVAYAVVVGASVFGFLKLPTGLVPPEDQGYVPVIAQLPEGASAERTREVVRRATEILLSIEGIRGVNGVPGFSVIDGGNLPNAATMFTQFTDWGTRPVNTEIEAEINKRLNAEIPDARFFALTPPAIRGLGQSGGFSVEIQDRGDNGLEQIAALTQAIASRAAESGAVAEARTTFSARSPRLFADIDEEKAQVLGVDLDAVYQTLQAQLGGAYVNDFNLFGRVFQVRLQAQGDARDEPGDLNLFSLRNEGGGMVPLGTLVEFRDDFGPQIIRRFNVYEAAQITGTAADGASAGEALTAVTDAAEAILPDTMGYALSGTSYQLRQAGGQVPGLLGLGAFFVFLVLAAQYESWSLPLGVVLAIPGGLVGAVAAVFISGTDINVYTQIGLVLLVALAAKNAILLVEFAAARRDEGAEPREAALEAAKLRFRPILMTSLSFALGMIPLVLASGAGAGARSALGLGVLGGQITAILLTLIVVPPLFYAITRYLTRGKSSDADGDADGDGRAAAATADVIPPDRQLPAC